MEIVEHARQQLQLVLNHGFDINSEVWSRSALRRVKILNGGLSIPIDENIKESMREEKQAMVGFKRNRLRNKGKFK